MLEGNGNKNWWMSARLIRCAECKKKTSVIAGTIFQWIKKRKMVLLIKVSLRDTILLLIKRLKIIIHEAAMVKNTFNRFFSTISFDPIL